MKVLELINDPALWVDSTTGQVSGNSTISQLLGYGDANLSPQPGNALFYPLLSAQNLKLEQVIQLAANKDGLDCQLMGKDNALVQVNLQQVELPASNDNSGCLLQVTPARYGSDNDSVFDISPFIEDVVDNIGQAIFLAPLSREGVHGNFVYVNKVACDRLKYTREELQCLNARTLNPNANQPKVKSMGRSIQREGKSQTQFDAIHVAKDGTEIPVYVIARVILIEGAEYVLSIVHDKRERDQQSTNESRFARLVDHSWDEIYVFSSSDFRFLQANQGALNNLGYSSKELCELKITDLAPEMSEADFVRRVNPLFEGHQSQIIYETKHKRKNGSYYPVEIRLQLSFGEVPPVFLANVQDITERKKIESHLKFLANYDSLTGLPNRALFMDRLTMSMEQSLRNEKLIALLYLDLDGFKQVNDSRGHLFGDELLKQVAIRLEQVLRRSDTVARLGGDEFCVITSNLAKTEDVDNVANKIVEVINTPFTIKGDEVSVSTSIGVCFFPFDDCDDSDDIMQKADAAMYRAKKLGKNNVQYFEENFQVEKQIKFDMENDLDRAINRGEFYLVYQPKLNLERMEITGVEALLRWQHPEKGLIPPLDFIYILENNGKIQMVGAWVLQQACLQMAEWNSKGHNLGISVNVSPRQMEHSQFPDVVQQCLQESGLTPELLELEITEGAVSEMTDKSVANMQKIKKLGVRISLDDFGSGYSSLSYIKRFTINSLKIDSEFVSDCEKNPESVVIVDSIIKLADGLRVNIIAEGIETEYQLNLLKSYGCQEGQGFFFAKPLTVDELDNKLKALSKIAS